MQDGSIQPAGYVMELLFIVHTTYISVAHMYTI